jgi:hypothetical protein
MICNISWVYIFLNCFDDFAFEILTLTMKKIFSSISSLSNFFQCKMQWMNIILLLLWILYESQFKMMKRPPSSESLTMERHENVCILKKIQMTNKLYSSTLS